ncbi:MBL fold metallo-hydrolase [Clostridium fermenticellae]|uniref:MBL fold metallo-hydrolase n=1 Tax=Clostridium fermenticellae TaxID=2068654 RepID=A0A386H189_9CLOT|nr:MBL fold metallo-hydrolase [Clostridium fermenticellae]AYD39434.1 MBL fold metallo-hydrolase [Clostridium fermenticellae]
MKKITDKLYQFSIYIPPMDFTIHQYLLDTDPAILFATGTAQQAQSTLSDIKKVLGDKLLKYIFISHVESDECGGISVLKKAYPDITVICGELAARELPGYGYTGKIQMKKGGETLTDGYLKLKFVDYPSEVHLQNGILCLEENSGIFYSADIALRFGNGVGKIIKGSWSDEVNAIDAERVPNEKACEKLKEDLEAISPNLIAVGHGFCIDCR